MAAAGGAGGGEWCEGGKIEEGRGGEKKVTVTFGRRRRSRRRGVQRGREKERRGKRWRKKVTVTVCRAEAKDGGKKR